MTTCQLIFPEGLSKYFRSILQKFLAHFLGTLLCKVNGVGSLNKRLNVLLDYTMFFLDLVFLDGVFLPSISST